MEISRFVNLEHRKVLEKARKTYGNTTQILISVEELSELACVCAKYPRFEDPERARKQLYNKALDEVADTLIVLDHIVNIFDLTPVDIGERVNAKIARVARWLDASPSQSRTMEDRDVIMDQTSLFEQANA